MQSRKSNMAHSKLYKKTSKIIKVKPRPHILMDQLIANQNDFHHECI